MRNDNRGLENDGQTELGFDRSDMIIQLRKRFAPEITAEEARLRDLGWNKAYIDAAIDVYLNLRCELRPHASALAGINVYLEALQRNISHADAFAEAMKVPSVVASTGEDEDVTIINGASQANVVVDPLLLAPAHVQTTLTADEQTFGVSTAGYTVDATLPATSETFAQPAADTTLKLADARKRIATAMGVDAATFERASVQAGSSLLSPDVVAPHSPVLVLEPKAPTKLSQREIDQHVAGCTVALKREGFGDFAEEGSFMYALLLNRGQVPVDAMKKVRVFCRQRQLGLDSAAAARAADGSGTCLPEHDEALDPNVEAAIREKAIRGISRSAIAAIIIGTTVVVGGAIALYVSHSHHEQPADVQTEPNP